MLLFTSKHMTLDELEKRLLLWNLPQEENLDQPAVATESMPMIQQLSMEMVVEMMQTSEIKRVGKDDAAEQANTRSKVIYGLYSSKDNIEIVADRTYEHGMGIKPYCILLKGKMILK